MSAIAVLMALLFLSFLGGFLTSSRRTLRGAGLPSGSEFILLGVLVGPMVLRLIPRASVAALDPIAYVAIGWLSVGSGLDYGHVGARRVRFGRILEGVLLSSACGGLIAAATYFALPLVTALEAGDRLLVAGGIGCVCAETTPAALRWVVQRNASGPLTDLLLDHSHSDEIVPIVAVAVLFALRSPVRATIHLPPLAWAGATLVVGMVLGVMTAILLARDLRLGESWGTILGTALMTIGLAARLDLAAITAMFGLGATLAWVSRHRADILLMFHGTERAVMLPVLMLAGARVDVSSLGTLMWIVPLAVAIRFAAKWLVGLTLKIHPYARGTGAFFGLGLVSSGGLSIAIGLAMALQFPGRAGETVLATAVASTLIGELMGPVMLRRALSRIGEIGDPVSTPVSSGEQEATA